MSHAPGTSVSVDGTLCAIPDEREVHLRLWRVPFFWQEREVAHALTLGLEGLGGTATHVKVILYRDIRTSVKEGPPGKVGGYKKAHCGGAALAVGRFSLTGRLTFRVDGGPGGPVGSFAVEQSTQQHTPFSSGEHPVPTLACCAYTPHPAGSVDEAGLLRLVSSAVPSAHELVVLLCRSAGRVRSMPRGVSAVHYLIECRDATAAVAVKGFLHDSRTQQHGTALPTPAVLHTAEFTKNRSGATVYKPLFIPPKLHAKPHAWTPYVLSQRSDNAATVQSAFREALPQQGGSNDAPQIPPYILDLVLEAAALVSAWGACESHALMGAVACASLLGHLG